MKRSSNYIGLFKLLILLIGFPYLIYSYGLVPTISAWNTSIGHKDFIKRFYADFPSDSNKLKEKADIHTEINLLKDGALLKHINKSLTENEVKPETFVPYLIKEEGDMELYVSEIILEGNYTGLTRLLSVMETDIVPKMIISVNYQINENPQTKKRVLLMSLLLQQIISKKE